MKRSDRRNMMVCAVGIGACEIALACLHPWTEAMLQPLLTAVLAWCIFVIAYRAKAGE